jgi:hypothetical protein
MQFTPIFDGTKDKGANLIFLKQKIMFTVRDIDLETK